LTIEHKLGGHQGLFGMSGDGDVINGLAVTYTLMINRSLALRSRICKKAFLSIVGAEL